MIASFRHRIYFKLGLGGILRWFWKVDKLYDCKVYHEKSYDGLYNFSRSNLSNDLKVFFSERDAYLSEHYSTDMVFSVNNVSFGGSYFLGLVEKHHLLRPTRINEHIFPSFFSYLRKLLFHPIPIGEVIFFDSYVSNNYNHFYRDVIFNFLLIRETKPEIRRVFISEKILQIPYVKFFFECEINKDLELVKAKNPKWYKADKVFFAKTAETKERWSSLANIFESKLLIKNGLGIKKFFLLRSKETGRTLVNLEVVIKFLNDYGYIPVDSAGMPLNEQISLFRDAESVVAIHGAGLTNVMYCKKLKFLIELHPKDRIMPHYYRLSKLMGAGYSAILGSKRNRKSNFEISISDLERELKLIEKSNSA